MAKNVERYFDEVARRKKSRRFLISCGIGLTVLFVVLAGCGRLIFYSSFFKIKNFTVSVGDTESPQQIKNALVATVLSQSFIARVLGADNVLSWVGSTPALPPLVSGSLKEITIQKDIRNRTVSITALPRAPKGIWCQKEREIAIPQSPQPPAETQNAGSTPVDKPVQEVLPPPVPTANRDCWWFDEDGIVIEKGPAADGFLVPLVTEYKIRPLILGKSVVDQDSVMKNILSLIKGITQLKLKTVTIEIGDINLQEATVHTGANQTILFSLRFPPDTAFSAIKALQAKGQFNTVSQLDFRVENRVYYK